MNPPGLLASFAATVILSLVHVLSGALTFLDQVPRSRWLSFAGGVAVALVFLEIIPELAEGQDVVGRALGPATGFLRNHIYLLAVAGLTLFYAMDREVKLSRAQQRSAGAGDHTGDGAFWLSMAVVATKNATVGYLLVREPRTLGPLAIFVFALVLEFTIGDRGMHADHKARYDRFGRWLLVGALFVGWAVGAVTRVPELGLAVLSALLAGMIILNVFKEELPQEREAKPWAFLAGLVVYAALLLVR